MRDLRLFLCWVVVLLGSIIPLSGCTYAAIQKLSLDEQAEFHIYQKVMTPSQERTYPRQDNRRRTHSLPS